MSKSKSRLPRSELRRGSKPKLNKHLWDHISSEMREKWFDRSPTICTDKWRNLLKEFKEAKHQDIGRKKKKKEWEAKKLRERNMGKKKKKQVQTKKHKDLNSTIFLF